MKKVLLAVLGRGCMMDGLEGPWVSTEDFDWWKLGVSRPNVITVPPDTDENCVIGGGKLQIDAAKALYRELQPVMTVFAYGNRSPYLKAHDYPSESEVMTGDFVNEVTEEMGIPPCVDTFDEDEWNAAGSSSYQEVHNLLSLALRLGVDEVVFLTIQVHMNRVLVMLTKHLKDPAFASLRTKVRFEITESVLLRTDAEKYAERVLAIFGSQAFLRNLERELNGSRAMYAGVTQTKQVAQAAEAPSK